MSTWAGRDDCTDMILDFIAGGVWGNLLGNPVGESDGNYNAVIGNAYSKDDLSQKTLGDIYSLMTSLLARKRPSTAVGRYQFIRPTLRTLQAKRGLPISTRFTPELQDQLAIDLLIGRGYPAWWRGQMTDEEFAHALSMEWASLPDPGNHGLSHFQGIGPNHASTSLVHVYDMLRRARAAQPGASS